ncbi:uncharacterized protein AAGF69_017114 [Amazona ochrocephala]
MEGVLSSEDPSEDDEETCTGPCRRALHGSGWWWSPWVFRDEQQTVKRQRTSLERRPKERPRARKKNDWRRRVKNKEEAASPESSAEEASQEQGKEKRQSPGGAETAPPRAESQKGEVEVLGEHHTEGMRLGFWCLRSSAPAPGLQSFF